MTNQTPITAQNFANKLAGWKRSASSMRGGAQALLDFGFSQYVEHGDAGYLSRTVASALEIKGLNAKRMLQYVTAHANVRWNEQKGSFSKAKKKDAPEVQERTVPWYEFNKAPAAPRPMDVNARLEKLLEQIQEAETVKVSMKEARETLRKLQGELDTIELQALEAEEAEEAEAEARRKAA